METYTEKEVKALILRIQGYASASTAEQALVAVGRVQAECDNFLRPIDEREAEAKIMALIQEEERKEMKDKEDGRRPEPGPRIIGSAL